MARGRRARCSPGRERFSRRGCFPCRPSLAYDRAARDATQLIPNVHELPGHIACDSASNAEVGIAPHDTHGQVVAVLDLDSPIEGCFGEEDARGLGLAGHAIGRAVDLTRPALA